MGKTPKEFPDERFDASQEIRHERELEKRKAAELIEQYLNRSGKDYIKDLRGLKYFFDYVRQLPWPMVLDIGSGSTKGINDIEKSSIGEGLFFEATSLHADRREVDEHLGMDYLHITSAEVLRGSKRKPIRDSTYGAVLALYALGWSHGPDLVMHRINDILIPGEYLKATSAELRGVLPPGDL